MIKITVVNKHHKQTGEYIGRGSPLGNPYPINVAIGHTRARVIELYKRWLEGQIAANNDKVCDELNRLVELTQHGELKLQCFCAPHPCHGDVIKQVLLKALK